MTKEMMIEANYISGGVEALGMEYLESLGATDARITWVDTDGTVLFDNKADVKTMENHIDREEIAEAMTSSAGNSVRYSGTLSEKTVYHAVRLSDGTVLRLAHTRDSVVRMVLGMLYPILVVVALAFILSIFLTVRLTNQLVEPLDNIDLEHPDETQVYDEMAPFINKISRQNNMIKRAMEEQQSQQKEFSLITENMQEGFIVIDKNAKILSYNTAALRIFETDCDVTDKNILVLNRGREFTNGINMALKGTHNENIIFLGGRYYNIYINPVMGESDVAGAIIIVTDVTEKEERDKLRREFTANVSHELKTPLTSISGVAEIIKNGIVADEDIPKFAGNIYSDAQRLIRLVEDIIRLSQLDEGKNLPVKEELDLYYIALEVANQLEDVADKRNINIDVKGKPATFMGIRPIIQEIVYNLCDNAIKYNYDNGKVIINVDSSPQYISITVEDTGIGIPEDQQDRIFERFYRVDKSHSREVGGTGLGLSIVKHGVKLHNGRINIDSKPEKGTKISIIFPV